MVIAPTPLRVNDELWFYYTGYDELHDLLPYHSAIGLAKLRKDGFASLDADECPGEILTKPFSGTGGVMQVNFDSRGGRLLVEVLDAEGRVIPGYGTRRVRAARGRIHPSTGYVEDEEGTPERGYDPLSLSDGACAVVLFHGRRAGQVR
jgi:hypothetical protein